MMIQLPLAQMGYNLFKGVVLTGLITLSVAVFSPGFLAGESGGCMEACAEKFKECRECEDEWEGYNGQLTDCSGSTCYYVCGSACETEGF